MWTGHVTAGKPRCRCWTAVAEAKVSTAEAPGTKEDSLVSMDELGDLHASQHLEQCSCFFEVPSVTH